MMTTFYIALGTLLAMLGISALNTAFFASFRLTVLTRWLRAIFVGLSIGMALEYIFTRPFAFMFMGGILIYFLIETLIYWVQLSSFNTSACETPFVQYSECENAWLCDKKYLKLKKKIESLGFQKKASFKNDFYTMPYLLNHFESTDKMTSLLVRFCPYGDKIYLTGLEFCTYFEDGTRVYTDNMPESNGFEYPCTWKCSRFPCVRSPKRLFKIHQKIVNCRAVNPIGIQALNLDADTAEMELANRRTGILSNDTIFSEEGMFRIWKDAIIFSYFPFLIK